MEEAQEMIYYYQHHTLHKKQISVNSKILNDLEIKLDNSIKKPDYGGVFVRLSSRSPKDSGFSTNKMHKLLSKRLQTLDYTNSEEEIQNAEFIAFFQAQIESLKVPKKTHFL